MHRRSWVIVAACVTVAGCSSGGKAPAASPAASRAPSAAADGTVHVSTAGSPQTQIFAAAARLSPGASVTFYGYQQPVSVGRALDAVAQQYVFGVADVKVCLGSKPETLAAPIADRNSWVLLYTNDSLIRPAAIRYPKEPTPSYPFTTSPRAANTCIRGKIVYPVPRNASPTSIAYAPYGRLNDSVTFNFS